MSDDLTNSQIALLCAIEEHDHSNSGSDQKRDLERAHVRRLRAGDLGPSRLRPFSLRPRASRSSANAALG